MSVGDKVYYIIYGEKLTIAASGSGRLISYDDSRCCIWADGCDPAWSGHGEPVFPYTTNVYTSAAEHAAALRHLATMSPHATPTTQIS